MHALSPFADIFGEVGDCNGILQRSMEMIGDAGAGIIVPISKLRNDRLTLETERRSGKPSDADMEDLRDHGAGAMILAVMGVGAMILLTNSHRTLVGLEGYGLSIVGERAIDSEA